MQRREARGDRGQGGKVGSGMAAGPPSNKCRAAGRCHRIRACQRSPRRRQRAQNSRRPRGGVSPSWAGRGGGRGTPPARPLPWPWPWLWPWLWPPLRPTTPAQQRPRRGPVGLPLPPGEGDLLGKVQGGRRSPGEEEERKGKIALSLRFH